MVVNDHGPAIVASTWSLTVLSGIFLGTRVYAKLSRRQGLWWDDHILIMSWFLLLVEATITQVGQHLGYGKHMVDIPPQNLIKILIGTFAGATISCFASTFSKISFGVTLLRLTKGPTRWFVWFCIVTLLIIMIPSAINSWVKCQPTAKAWNPYLPGKCWPESVTLNYGIFNAAWCAFADFALALLPWKLLWGLQLKQREKLGVGIAMSIGVLSGVCAIVKGYYLVQIQAEDFFYNGKDLTIWTAVETATAIIAASIPVLRVFFKEAVSSYNHSRSGRATETNARTIALSRISVQPVSITTTVRAGSKEGGKWTQLETIEDGSGDGASQKGILKDVKVGVSKGESKW